MKTGTHPTKYEKKITKWVVEGWSKRSNCKVYPHEGWSWTEWQSKITDTYKTFSEAKRAISGGYLKDMIDHQKIVDITFFEIVTEQIIDEKITITPFQKNGGENTSYVSECYETPLGKLYPDDYFIGAMGDNSHTSLYCQVEAIRNGLLYVDVVNGAYQLVINIQQENLYVDVSSPHISNRPDFHILYIGVPSSKLRKNDYNGQMNHFREHLTTA